MHLQRKLWTVLGKSLTQYRKKISPSFNEASRFLTLICLFAAKPLSFFIKVQKALILTRNGLLSNKILSILLSACSIEILDLSNRKIEKMFWSFWSYLYPVKVKSFKLNIFSYSLCTDFINKSSSGLPESKQSTIFSEFCIIKPTVCLKWNWKYNQSISQ